MPKSYVTLLMPRQDGALDQCTVCGRTFEHGDVCYRFDPAAVVEQGNSVDVMDPLTGKIGVLAIHAACFIRLLGEGRGRIEKGGGAR